MVLRTLKPPATFESELHNFFPTGSRRRRSSRGVSRIIAPNVDLFERVPVKVRRKKVPRDAPTWKATCEDCTRRRSSTPIISQRKPRIGAWYFADPVPGTLVNGHTTPTGHRDRRAPPDRNHFAKRVPRGPSDEAPYPFPRTEDSGDIAEYSVISNNGPTPSDR